VNGNRGEDHCDPCNVQVLSKDKDDRTLTLSDHEGVFLTVTPDSERESADSTELHDREGSQSSEPVEANEL